VRSHCRLINRGTETTEYARESGMKWMSGNTKRPIRAAEPRRHLDPLPLPARALDLSLREGKIHRVDPDFGSTLTVSNRDYQSNCWVDWKIMGQPCEL
jgi:hypothetical protein